MLTKDMKEDRLSDVCPFTQIEERVYLSDDAVEYFTHEYMIKTVIEGNLNLSYTRINFSTVLAHVCWENRKASKIALRTILNMINKLDKSTIVDQIRILSDLLLVEDGLQR